ncbi:MAG: histidine kinase [Bryobacterales bacterium]|nr:histidine kinase [Bryobacterales bacterium]MBV9396659.1 histidine kinase [Bryobacterales bacterium]
MSTLHELQIVNILGHSAGAIIFGIFVYLLLRDRAGASIRGSWLSVAAAGLAFLWNGGSLGVLIATTRNSEYTNIVVSFSFAVLSLLPAVLLHLSLEGSFRPVIGAGYALSLSSVGMHLLELFRPGRLFQQRALLLITFGFAVLTLLSAGAIIIRGSVAGKARVSRLFGAMFLCLFAMSFVHFGSGHPAHAWSSELILHHAGIPIALFVLLQDYRFVLLDAFVRFLANVFVAAILTVVAVRITFPWIMADERISENPIKEAVLLLSLCILLIAFALARGEVQRWLTKVVFRRPELDAALQEIESKGSSFATEADFVKWASGYLGRFVSSDRVEAVPDHVVKLHPEISCLVFPALSSDVAALRHAPELAWAEVIVPLPSGPTESRYLLFGRRKGGRRYLSEDLQALSRLTAAIMAQIDRFRNLEMQRLVSEAELRALQSQINPHFLFNALNALYGIIPRSAQGARKTVVHLSEIFRYFLQSERRFIALADEMEIIKAYLEIERLRLGPRLEVEIDLDEAALPVQIPVLSIQPLVENAIKHGLAPKEGPGLLRLFTKVEDGRVLITVEDNGTHIQDDERIHDRAGAGVGLANVKRRLQLCYGVQADLAIEAGPTGTRVQFAVPAAVNSGATAGSSPAHSSAA